MISAIVPACDPPISKIAKCLQSLGRTGFPSSRKLEGSNRHRESGRSCRVRSALPGKIFRPARERQAQPLTRLAPDGNDISQRSIRSFAIVIDDLGAEL